MTGQSNMDPGPGLNYFSLDKARTLFRALRPLCVPETVPAEIIRHAQNDKRLHAPKPPLEKFQLRCCKTRATTAQHKKAGNYFLDVKAANFESWTVRIEQKQ